MRLTFDHGLAPFRFPTTTVMVDDHETYLGVVPLMLDPLQRLRSYSSPRQALSDLRRLDSRAVPGGGWLYRWREHPWYRDCAEFCARYDQNSFDPAYDTLPLDHFVPLVRNVLSTPRRSLYLTERSPAVR